MARLTWTVEIVGDLARAGCASRLRSFCMLSAAPNRIAHCQGLQKMVLKAQGHGGRPVYGHERAQWGSVSHFSGSLHA